MRKIKDLEVLDRIVTKFKEVVHEELLSVGEYKTLEYFIDKLKDDVINMRV